MTLGMKMVEVPRKDLGHLTSCKCVSHVSTRLLKQNKKFEKSKRIHTSHTKSNLLSLSKYFLKVLYTILLLYSLIVCNKDCRIRNQS